MRKKEDRKDIYWERLSVRLQQERNNQELTQQQLADKTGVSREKINYVELNITGRTLQINELARIAKELNASIDYLVGLTESKDFTSYNGLSDKANEIISNLDSGSLEMYGLIAEEYTTNEVLKTWKIYRIITKIISQLNSNMLEFMENKMLNQDRIPNPDMQKIAFIYSYIIGMRTQKVGFPEYIKALWEQYEDIIQPAIEECSNLLNYNEDRSIKVDFTIIKKLVEPLTKFKDYVRYNLDHNIKISIDNIAEADIKDEQSYNKLKQYANEISKEEGLKQQKDTTVKKSK